MAESTRSKSNWDRLEEAIAKLASNQIHIIEKLDDLMHCITTLENTSPPTTSPSSSSAMPAPPTHLTNPPKMELDVPRFDGENPSGWVFKIMQFFEYHSTPESECLTIASFYMEGPVLAWFQWMMRNH